MTSVGGVQAFAPMSPYANSFVQKAAGLYGLKSGQQGSGRKRFVIVAATKHTRLPEAAERERLAHMLASNDNAAAALRPLTTKPTTSGKGAPAHTVTHSYCSSQPKPRTLVKAAIHVFLC